MRCSIARWATAAGAAIVVLAAGAPRAGAHQPLFLDDAHPTAEEGPRIVDGKVSFAIYTTLDGAGDSRGLRFTLAAGDPLVVELLIPDQAPERNLADAELPEVTVMSPSGAETRLASALGEAFDEPFTQTRYIRLARLDAVGEEGTYGVTVRGRVPARVTIVTGREERSGEVDGAGSAGTVAQWWSRPPPTDTDTPAAASTGSAPAVAVVAGDMSASVAAPSAVPPAAAESALASVVDSSTSTSATGSTGDGGLVTSATTGTIAMTVTVAGAMPETTQSSPASHPGFGNSSSVTPWWVLWLVFPVALVAVLLRFVSTRP